MAEQGWSAEGRLQTIADMLGIPMDSFFSDDAPKKLADAVECARLWDALQTDQSRDLVLTYLREVVARQTD